jgi:protein-S-isoprenylcysteine O-methyltransferase Ste14
LLRAEQLVQPLVSAQPAAKVIFVAAIALFMVVQLRVAGASLVGRITRRKVGVVRRDRGSQLVVIVTSGVGIVGAFLFAAKVHSAAIAGGNAVIQWLCLAVGVGAVVCGSLGRQWAISTLGRFFTLNVQVSDDQRVVTSGPYRWVRHPSYTADLVAFTGVGLALGNWLSLLAASVLPLLGLLVRIRVEEAALLTGLGEPYRAFADGKKRLLPRVW